jgi:hypothetical protein
MMKPTKIWNVLALFYLQIIPIRAQVPEPSLTWTVGQCEIGRMYCGWEIYQDLSMSTHRSTAAI